VGQRGLVLGHEGILLVVGRRRRSGHLGRSRVGGRVVLLGRGRAAWRTARRTGALAARGGSGLWGLGVTWRALACWWGVFLQGETRATAVDARVAPL
jgi:hypothetical protein